MGLSGRHLSCFQSLITCRESGSHRGVHRGLEGPSLLGSCDTRGGEGEMPLRVKDAGTGTACTSQQTERPHCGTLSRFSPPIASPSDTSGCSLHPLAPHPHRVRGMSFPFVAPFSAPISSPAAAPIAPAACSPVAVPTFPPTVPHASEFGKTPLVAADQLFIVEGASVGCRPAAVCRLVAGVEVAGPFASPNIAFSLLCQCRDCSCYHYPALQDSIMAIKQDQGVSHLEQGHCRLNGLRNWKNMCFYPRKLPSCDWHSRGNARHGCCDASTT